METYLDKDEKKIIDEINLRTTEGNQDNITRTNFYNEFYQNHNEVIWSCLASFVSRNAGWNMTDLEGDIFSRLIPKQYREILFLTYERANWLIFSDAFPQLLLYEASLKEGKPLFYLLKHFHVSVFMEREWYKFWIDKNVSRLCTALIINEQNLIQKPVLEDPFYRDKVFKSIPFFMEELLHFSTVLFPTFSGQLYGFSVYGFNHVGKRIDLGKRLAWLLFQSKQKSELLEFASNVEHTGSRFDYEKFVKNYIRKETLPLRSLYPIIEHHRSSFEDWYSNDMDEIVDKYFYESIYIDTYELTDWYEKKQKQLLVAADIETRLMKMIKG